MASTETSTTGTSEYDRFGPWIDEVREPHEVPRLYRDHPLDLDAARLVLKVPRNVARRDATPDMDLYDHLLVVADDTLTVLSRRTDPRAKGPGGYDVRHVRLADVVAVQDVVNLLDARLTVHTRDGAHVTVRYNGSAADAVHGLVEELRAGAAAVPATPAGLALLRAGTAHADPDALTLGPADLSLRADVREAVRRRPSLTPWAGHPRRPVRPSATGSRGVVARLAHALSPAVLHGCVLAGDGTAFEVVGRHAWLLRGRAPVHSASRLVVPLGAVDRVELASHPDYAHVVVAALVCGATTVRVLVPAGTAAHGVLAVATGAGAATAEV